MLHGEKRFSAVLKTVVFSSYGDPKHFKQFGSYLARTELPIQRLCPSTNIVRLIAQTIAKRQTKSFICDEIEGHLYHIVPLLVSRTSRAESTICQSAA